MELSLKHGLAVLVAANWAIRGRSLTRHITSAAPEGAPMLQLIVTVMSNRKIAEELIISVGNVKAQKSSGAAPCCGIFHGGLGTSQCATDSGWY